MGNLLFGSKNYTKIEVFVNFKQIKFQCVILRKPKKISKNSYIRLLKAIQNSFLPKKVKRLGKYSYSLRAFVKILQHANGALRHSSKFFLVLLWALRICMVVRYKISIENTVWRGGDFYENHIKRNEKKILFSLINLYISDKSLFTLNMDVKKFKNSV